MSRDFNDAMDEINFAEQRRHRQMGFTRGYSVGEEAGWRDGYIFGVRKGAQLSAEIGYYQGFAHAWIAVLEREDTHKQRKLTALNSLLELTRGFPKSNSLLEDDTIQKLARIRAKFKQVNALILGSTNVIHTANLNANAPQMPAAGHGGGAGPAHGAHGSVFRGASWTSQDSGAGSYGTGSVHAVSPNPQSFASCNHKTEMSF